MLYNSMPGQYASLKNAGMHLSHGFALIDLYEIILIDVSYIYKSALRERVFYLALAWVGRKITSVFRKWEGLVK